VEFNVSAGGLAVWIAATFCAVAMTSTLFLGGIVLWLAIRTNDHGHQMNALYQSVPGLRELVAEQMRLNHETKQAERQEPTE
jgi:CHASE3 domain sensor protein